ncbi:hypothetical protein ACQP2Y_21015 [Actinoplanes sp. CA-051413]|uniref:hypothetical protein n=1 Tax=Actinoplanes sp. CA-051413 TaxID=3239899 RepID=UPI003D984E56
MTDYVVAGTGSRSLRMADRAAQIDAMERCTAILEQRQAEKGPFLVVMSGGTEGFDELIARCALKLGIFLWLALPNRTYVGHYWGRASVTGRDRRGDFAEIMNGAGRVTHVMEEVHGTTELKLNGKHANFWRNDWMVQQAQEFLVWDPTSKGTAHCLTQIKKAGLPYKVLSPEPATLPL